MKNDIYITIRRMLTGLLVIFLLWSVMVPLSAGGEEQPGSMAAKVTTEKGALKLRKAAGPKERVIGEIPNGTCILVTKEADDWCEVSWNGQTRRKSPTTAYRQGSSVRRYTEASGGILRVSHSRSQ